MLPREHPRDDPHRRAHLSQSADDGSAVDGARARRPLPPIAGRGLFWNRRAARLDRATRLRLQVRRDELLGSLSAIEDSIDRLTGARLDALTEADELRDRLWPIDADHKGRRPPSVGRPPLPPMRADARPLAGRCLRSTCLEILRAHGELALPDLHARLHHYGHAIDSATPAKALADAMAYEVELGRAVRLRWGVYDLSPSARDDLRPSDAWLDPWLDNDPPTWAGHPGFGPRPPADCEDRRGLGVRAGLSPTPAVVTLPLTGFVPLTGLVRSLVSAPARQGRLA